jgi:acyl carrier protein
MQTDLGRPAPAPTTSRDLLAAVREVLAETVDHPADQIAEGADLEVDLGVDSLAMIHIVVGLEERFGIAVPASASPEDLRIRTVAELARYVGELVAAQRGEKAR